jgi:hypothetical protein
MAPTLDACSASLERRVLQRRFAKGVRCVAAALLALSAATAATRATLAAAQPATDGKSERPAGSNAAGETGAPALQRAAAAAASDEAAYQQLIDRALAAFRATEYAQARTLFERAHAVQPSARTLRGLGVTAVALGRYVDATRELQAAQIDARRPLTRVEHQEVAQLLEWMRTSLVALRLELSPTHASALIDDHPAAAGELLLVPGEHELRVQAEGYESDLRRLNLKLGQTESLRVQLSPAATKLSPNAAAASARRSAAATDARTKATAPHEEVSIFGRWWFWTGVAAVTIGGAIAALALDGEEQPLYEQGGVGGVHRALSRAP